MNWRRRAELDAKVALVRRAGYVDMPWGRARRTATELGLLVLAAVIIEDEQSLELVKAGVPIRAYNPELNQIVRTDADYWTRRIAAWRAELATACAAANSATHPNPA